MNKLLLTCAMACLAALAAGCTTTQKTPGRGFTSAKAQTVVRLASVKAFRDAEVPDLSGKTVVVNVTGFADEQTTEMIEYFAKSLMRLHGARVVERGVRDMELDVGVMAAGIDYGSARIPLIWHSERIEGMVDVDAVLRNYSLDEMVSTERLVGEAKHEQSWILGIQLPEKYFVKNDDGKFEKVISLDDYRDISFIGGGPAASIEMFVVSYCYVDVAYSSDSTDIYGVSIGVTDQETFSLSRGEKRLMKTQPGKLTLQITDPLPGNDYQPQWKPFEIEFETFPLSYTRFLVKTRNRAERAPIIIEMYRDDALADWWSIPTR